MDSSHAPAVRRSSLQLRIGAAFAALALALFTAVGWFSGQQAREQVAQDIQVALVQVAERLAASLEADMFERWREIQNLAEMEGLLDAGADPARWRPVLERLQKTYPDYAWIGFADPSGKVLAATGGVLEGQSVAARPWFKEALDKPFAGDVHDAVLLARLLPPQAGGEPLRLVDVAAPVMRDGRLAGVLGSHLSWRWADERRRFILRPLETQQVEAAVVNGRGELLLGPGSTKATLSAEGLRRLVERGPGVETWSDGRAYLSALATAGGYRSYPGLGWTVVVRQPVETALAPAARLARQIWIFGLLGALAFGALAWWLARRLTAPLRSLAHRAQRLSAEPLPSSTTQPTDEVAGLAEALGALMHRLQERGDELARANQTLEQRVHERTEALELANEDLKSFSRSVSHDLKGPLGGMATALNLLVDREAARLEPNAQRMLAAVSSECNRLRQLIDELMALARVEHRPLQWDAVSMTELARFVVDRVRREAPAAAAGEAAAPEAELLMGELPVAHGDPVLLHQVWHNLVSNAVKFSRGVRAPRIEIGAETTEHEIVYSVSDNGNGFDMAQASRLFGVFQRLHRDADFPGTGIGLSIVKRIVHRHGGRVWAHSVPGQRTSFFFALPRVRRSKGATAG